MKLGLVLPIWSDGVGPGFPDWNALIAMCGAAEEAGYDSLWVGDTLLLFDLPAGLLECWSVLAAVAQATECIRLGSLVSANPFRHPALTAKIAQTVDDISAHRIILGLGSGGATRQHLAFGAAVDNRFDRLEEALPLIISLLRGEAVTHHGRFYDIEEAELLPRQSWPTDIPLLLAGVSDRLIRLSARCADYWNGWVAYSDSSAAAVMPLLERVNALCEREGRDPASLATTVGIGVRLHHAPLTAGPLDVGKGAICGTLFEVGKQLEELASLGLDMVQITFAPSTVATIRELGTLLKHFQ